MTVGSETRKFIHKSYGSPDLALMACEAFQKETNALLHVFDSHKRKPEPRRELLISAGVDEKFWKASIANQREALIRKLARGKVKTVEDKVMGKIFQNVIEDKNSTGWALTVVDDKFKASFQGGKHNVERLFSTVPSAVEWLQSMTLAEKVWFCVSKTYIV